jgi:adenosylhomocysteine nucleosidase
LARFGAFLGNESAMHPKEDVSLPLIAASGLDFEAAVASGPNVKVVSGLDRWKYRRDLHELARGGARGIISFGIAGGISPSLRAGDVVVASDVITANGCFKPCEKWSASLLAALPDIHHLPIYGSSVPLLSASEKQAVWHATGAGTVDMESRDAAEVAAQYGLPFAVLRVVLDPAYRNIPLSALAGADASGKTDARAVISELTRRPQDLPGIMSVANDARKANSSLHRCRRALGPLMAFGGISGATRVQDRSYSRSSRYVYASPFRGAFYLFLHIPRWFDRR